MQKVTFSCDCGTDIIIYPETDSAVITHPTSRMRGGPVGLTLGELLGVLLDRRNARKRKG